MNLFQKRDFTSHSGKILNFKIECDALTEDDIDCVAHIIKEKFWFQRVIGVPTGGDRLAKALEPFCIDNGSTLIVDDVLSTGNSMNEVRHRLIAEGTFRNRIFGVVIFSRGYCPEWIYPVFKLGVNF